MAVIFPEAVNSQHGDWKWVVCLCGQDRQSYEGDIVRGGQLTAGRQGELPTEAAWAGGQSRFRQCWHHLQRQPAGLSNTAALEGAVRELCLLNEGLKCQKAEQGLPPQSLTPPWRGSSRLLRLGGRSCSLRMGGGYPIITSQSGWRLLGGEQVSDTWLQCGKGSMS